MKRLQGQASGNDWRRELRAARGYSRGLLNGSVPRSRGVEVKTTRKNEFRAPRSGSRAGPWWVPSSEAAWASRCSEGRSPARFPSPSCLASREASRGTESALDGTGETREREGSPRPSRPPRWPPDAEPGGYASLLPSCSQAPPRPRPGGSSSSRPRAAALRTNGNATTGTGLRPCTVRTPLIGSCATATGTGWSASELPAKDHASK